MSSYINLFLSTEITCIPRLLTKLFGHYYNNAWCNGATWLFWLLCLLRFLFDRFLNAFLRRLKYKEYLRKRLCNSLWYLGFYGTAVAYCGATLVQNELELFNFKRMHVPASNVHLQYLGYTLLSTFYFHSGFWEGFANGRYVEAFKYLLLSSVLNAAYALRIVEISFTITGLIGIAQIALELTRCFLILSKQDHRLMSLLNDTIFAITFLIYLAVYCFVIPLTFAIPMALRIMSDYPDTLFLLLFFSLNFYLSMEYYNSVVVKLCRHWIYHIKEVENEFCGGTMRNCALFEPRNDTSFNVTLLRQEMKAREEYMLSKRKPKNRGMLLQTLTCMVAIKRKLKKRRGISDDSEESSE